jgi:regulator of protease activity HflC (stomatin/prohibitin superfamily)
MFLFTVSILLFIGLFISLNLKRNSQRVYWQFSRRSFLSFFALLLVIPSCFSQVNANEVGIIYDPLNGGIQEIALNEGIHFKTPLQQVKTISTKLREDTYVVQAQTGKIVKQLEDGTFEETGGGQWATYTVTIQYKVEVANAHRFYRNFGGDVIPQSTVEARLREALQDNSVKFDIFSILKGGLNEVRSETELSLSDSLLELGVTIDAFIILDVDAGDVIEAVVEAEATAAKQKEIAIKEQEAELIRQTTQKLSAEINAERVLIDADANAEAQRVLNSVTASAIYTMYEGQFLNTEGDLNQNVKSDFEINGVGGFLTIKEIGEIIIKQLYYDTWDGVLPTVVAGESADIIINP